MAKSERASSGLKTAMQAVTTVLTAVALGFVVQYGETDPNQVQDQPRPVYNKAPTTVMMALDRNGQPVFGLPDVAVAPSDHSANTVAVAAVDEIFVEPTVPVLGPIVAFPIIGCSVDVDAKRQPVAQVTLDIRAPCHAGQAVLVAHAGLSVSAQMDSAGNAQLLLPALEARAAFDIRIDNILYQTVSIFVPEVRRYDRAVVQWTTDENIRLHAFENNAEIGTSGHVWSASVHRAEDADAGRNGFVTFFGRGDTDIPNQAEVYTFPQGRTLGKGWVDLRIGVAVTPGNCGREVDAHIIVATDGIASPSVKTALPMPGCDQVGEIAMMPTQFERQG